MFTVGVAGGIGSGKSTVCRVFSVLGIPVFSSDDEGKRLLGEDDRLRAQLSAAFGEGVLAGGKLDRRALAARVFNNPAALQRLNAIVHPAVRNAFAAWAVAQHAPYVINEAAILVETGGHEQLDHLVVVTAPEQERIRRVVERDGATEAQVRARMQHQTDDRARLAVAGSVITNDNRAMVIPQVLAVHHKLMNLARA
ncbi:MAG: dephospho-CoA kinase [Flavobacteriales bacterium]|mgnify:CR=1 FL=1|nr:dephospho-CoA kinase [Flavobacteriales bacterium]HRN35596.1 dephospho-CoA kinase [Flavobacteriales bacterium]HRO38608.1 dephospho-CoA kinase [Flavobacteriales bacterium]HRP81584.1 dephospho-CoA kinase [Flavobacteriales bacterium]